MAWPATCLAASAVKAAAANVDFMAGVDLPVTLAWVRGEEEREGREEKHTHTHYNSRHVERTAAGGMGVYIYALPVCFSILCRALSLPAFSPAIQSRGEVRETGKRHSTGSELPALLWQHISRMP